MVADGLYSPAALSGLRDFQGLVFVTAVGITVTNGNLLLIEPQHRYISDRPRFVVFDLQEQTVTDQLTALLITREFQPNLTGHSLRLTCPKIRRINWHKGYETKAQQEKKDKPAL